MRIIQTDNPGILPLAQELFEYTRGLRRDFHRYPELAFHENRTAGIVANELSALGLQVKTGIAATGISAMIEGDHPGPVVLLRFDMDALPIHEENQVEYASLNQGVMHACGHDGHTAIGLTAARILVMNRPLLSGKIKLVFQPAEESLGGADQMIREGILENPNPDYALGLHLWNEKPVGWVGLKSGPMMAAAETYKIEIRGKGGHGALPHFAVDPLLASAQLVVGLQSIVSRNVSPLKTAVVSVTMIRGGETSNVIPPIVYLQGTIRTFDPDVRETVMERFEQIVYGTAAVYGCEAVIEYDISTPALNNHPTVTRAVLDTIMEVSKDFQIESDFMTMGSEDMACFLQRVPGCFFFVGSSNAEKELNAPHHHPRFDFDETVLPNAAALIVEAALRMASI